MISTCNITKYGNGSLHGEWTAIEECKSEYFKCKVDTQLLSTPCGKPVENSLFPNVNRLSYKLGHNQRCLLVATFSETNQQLQLFPMIIIWVMFRSLINCLSCLSRYWSGCRQVGCLLSPLLESIETRNCHIDSSTTLGVGLKVQFRKSACLTRNCLFTVITNVTKTVLPGALQQNENWISPSLKN